jgi:hypothetical protein
MEKARRAHGRWQEELMKEGSSAKVLMESNHSLNVGNNYLSILCHNLKD